MPFAEYPKWVKVEGPGNPENPGYVLVNTEDQELEVLSGGSAPLELNPGAEEPADGDKSVESMERSELIAAIVKGSFTDEVSDDDLRDILKRIHDRDAGHDAGDGKPPETDVAGDKIAPDVADEANKGSFHDETRTLPEADTKPATDARPDDAKAKEADDQPATDQVDAASTPADEPKTRRRAHASPKSDD